MTTTLSATVFPAVLNMSAAAIPIICAVLLARLILKRAPKIFSYVLWAVVLFRLLCPVSLSASFSLLGALNAPVRETAAVISTVEYVHPMPPSAVPVTPELPQEPMTPADSAAAASPAPTVPEIHSAEPMEILAWVWLAGLLAMLAYNGVSLLLFRRKLIGSGHLRDNIYLADYLETAFVMGVLRPRIYLPSTLRPQEQSYILLHEQHHIHRLDPLWKLLAFLALAIHWFNPLVWLSFHLAARDMEMSCDEAVVRQLGSGIRTDYSESLLNLAAGRRLLTAPLAFGEGDTRSRITNVLNWKQPRTWVVLLSTIGCVALVAACGVNPVKSVQGKYASMDEYLAKQIAELPPTLKLYTAQSETDESMEEVTYRTIVSRLDFLEEMGHQAELDPKGELTVWRYNYSTQIDLDGQDPNNVGWVGGCYTDEEGFYHGEGQHIAVSRTYPDGSLDILDDSVDIDGTGFLTYNETWDDALYDWYVQENGLEAEFPLFVKDWQDRITYPEGASMGNYPVHRADGDGWYFYLPIQSWKRADGYGDTWESGYDTGSALTVYHFDHSAEAQASSLVNHGGGGYWEPVDGSATHVRRTEKEQSDADSRIEDFYTDDPNGGSWCVRIEWYPEVIAAHQSPYTRMEPDVLHLMAESFTVDERIHPVQHNAAEETVPELWGVRSGDNAELLLTQGHTSLRQTSIWEADSANDYFRHLSELSWKESDGLNPTTHKGGRVTLTTDLWQITAYEETQIVRKQERGSDTWLEVDSDDYFDKPYEYILRSWVDDVEYEAKYHGEDLFVPDHGQTWQEAVAEFAEKYPAQQPKFSPGSHYCHTFVKVLAQPDEELLSHFREYGHPDNEYPFHTTVIFVPENERALNAAMAGNTGEYTGSDPAIPAGAYEYYRCSWIRQEDDGWHVEIGGTGW